MSFFHIKRHKPVPQLQVCPICSAHPCHCRRDPDRLEKIALVIKTRKDNAPPSNLDQINEEIRIAHLQCTIAKQEFKELVERIKKNE
jgi:hypothetical protein